MFEKVGFRISTKSARTASKYITKVIVTKVIVTKVIISFIKNTSVRIATSTPPCSIPRPTSHKPGISKDWWILVLNSSYHSWFSHRISMLEGFYKLVLRTRLAVYIWSSLIVSSWLARITILPLTKRLVRPSSKLPAKERIRGFIMMLIFMFSEGLLGYCVFVKGGIIVFHIPLRLRNSAFGLIRSRICKIKIPYWRNKWITELKSLRIWYTKRLTFRWPERRAWTTTASDEVWGLSSCASKGDVRTYGICSSSPRSACI